MDVLRTLAFGMGSAWLSGINLYAAVLTLGLLQRFELVQLPGDLGRLSDSWLIGLAAALYAVEFIADKIPAVDSTWDAIHTFIRVPAGAILAASAFAHFDPKVRIAALLIGGGTALSSHGMKATTRLAANTSPEPFSNITLSFIEDVIAFGSSILLAFHPLMMLVVVLIFVVAAVLILPRVYRALSRLFRRASATQ